MTGSDCLRGLPHRIQRGRWPTLARRRRSYTRETSPPPPLSSLSSGAQAPTHLDGGDAARERRRPSSLLATPSSPLLPLLGRLRRIPCPLHAAGRTGGRGAAGERPRRRTTSPPLLALSLHASLLLAASLLPPKLLLGSSRRPWRSSRALARRSSRSAAVSGGRTANHLFLTQSESEVTAAMAESARRWGAKVTPASCSSYTAEAEVRVVE